MNCNEFVNECVHVCGCVQLGDWTFYASGVGLVPGPQEPVNITSTVNDHASTIIPFHNPTDVHLLVDVCLPGQSHQLILRNYLPV